MEHEVGVVEVVVQLRLHAAVVGVKVWLYVLELRK